MRDRDPLATFTRASVALNQFNLAYLHILEALPGHMLSGCAKLFVSLRATAKQSQHFEIASFHCIPLAMTNAQLILPKYLAAEAEPRVSPHRCIHGNE